MPWLYPDSSPLASLFPGQFLNFWENLAGFTGQADPFCCAPVWNLSYHAIFTPKRRVFYETFDNSALIFGEYLSPRGETIYAPLEESWLFGQPLLGDSSPELLGLCLKDLLAEQAGKKVIFCISGMQDGSYHAMRLFRLFSPHYRFYKIGGFTQARASLAGGLDGWLANRSANHRAKLRKAARKGAQAGVEFTRARPGPGEAAKIYERMLAIEERSWKGQAHNGMSDSPSREFYGYMIRKLAESGNALVIFATQDGTDLGFIFGGLLGACYRGQQFSYIQAAAPLSIGNLMQMEKVRWLCELGASFYDMGTCTGPRMDYKLHWTEIFREAQTWVLTPVE